MCGYQTWRNWKCLTALLDISEAAAIHPAPQTRPALSNFQKFPTVVRYLAACSEGKSALVGETILGGEIRGNQFGLAGVW